jgi:hypothetical protein
MRIGQSNPGEYAVPEAEPLDHVVFDRRERDRVARACALHLSDLKTHELYPDAIPNPDIDRR